MSERFTSDIPAIPDPDFVSYEPGRRKQYLAELFEEGGEIPEYARSIFEEMRDAKNRNVPKQYDYYVEQVFDEANAQTFIDTYAVYDHNGRLDLDKTSAKIGIPYDYRLTEFGQGQIEGLPGPHSSGQPTRIHLEPNKRYNTVTFGHEIGHYFWRAVLHMGLTEYDPVEEKFCDYFGRRMALPRQQLERYGTIDKAALIDIMEQQRAGLRDTVIALMEEELLPPRIAIDSYNPPVPNPDYSRKVNRGMVCLHCTQTGGDYACPSVGTPTPLFDFTDRSWGGAIGSCCGEDLLTPEIASTLTKHYEQAEAQLVLFRPVPDEHQDLYDSEG